MYTTLLGIIVGAVFSGLIQWFLKWRELQQRRKTLAISLANEINALISVIDQREYTQVLQEAYEKKKPICVAIGQSYFEIYEANLSEIGLLQAKDASNIVKFYKYAKSFLEDVKIALSHENDNSQYVNMYPEIKKILETARGHGLAAVASIEKRYRHKL
jgi:hypothetical protein